VPVKSYDVDSANESLVMEVSLGYFRMLFKYVGRKITIKLLVLFLCIWEVLFSNSDHEIGNPAL